MSLTVIPHCDPINLESLESEKLKIPTCLKIIFFRFIMDPPGAIPLQCEKKHYTRGYSEFERENKRIGKAQAIQAIYKSLYQKRYMMSPTNKMIDLESSIDEMAVEQSTTFFAITLNPNLTTTCSPSQWASFIHWVQQLPNRAYFDPAQFEYHVEQRPEKGPESRHVHLIIKSKLNRSASTIQQSLSRNTTFFGNPKHVQVDKVYSKSGWLTYCRKNNA